MGCGSSTAAGATPQSQSQSQPIRRPLAADTPEQRYSSDDQTTPATKTLSASNDASSSKAIPATGSPSSPPHNGTVAPAQSAPLLSPHLSVLSQRLLSASGDFAPLLQALIVLAEIVHTCVTRAAWLAELQEQVDLLASELAAAGAAFSNQFYVQRLTTELQATRLTLDGAMKPGPGGAIGELLLTPLLQARVRQHRDALHAIRSEAMAGALLEVAGDVQQTRGLIDSIVGGRAGESTLPPSDTTTAAAVPTSETATPAPIPDSALSAPLAAPSFLPPALQNVWSALGRLHDTVRRFDAALHAERKGQEPSAVPPWTDEFARYLTQVESELRDTRLLGEASRPELAQSLMSHTASLSDALEEANQCLTSVLQRHILPNDTGGMVLTRVARFLCLLAVDSDRDALFQSKQRIEAAKAALIGALLTALQSENRQLAEQDLARLKTYLAQQEAAVESIKLAVRRRREDELLAGALRPVDCSAEIGREYARFLPGTRSSVIARVRQFAGLSEDSSTPAAMDDTPSDPSQSRLLLLLSSPGHGKTVLMSHLVQAHASSVAACHFFRFDAAQRRGVQAAIRSLAWQAAQRIPGLRAHLIHALRSRGVEVEEETASNSAAQGAQSDKSSTAAPSTSGLDSLNALELWDALLVQPLWSLDKERQQAESESATSDSSSSLRSSPPRWLLVLDALDESEQGAHNLLAPLLGHVASGDKHHLPPWVGVLLSARPESHILRAFGKQIKQGTAVISLDTLDSTPTHQPNVQTDVTQPSDLRLFFEAVCRVFMPPPPSADDSAALDAHSRSQSECVDLLLSKSRGMFLHTRLMLEAQGFDLGWIGREEEVERRRSAGEDLDGWRLMRVEEVRGYASGLGGFYREMMQRATSGASAAAPLHELVQLLRFVIAAFEPLTLLQLQQLMRYDSIEDVLRRSGALRSELPIKNSDPSSTAPSSTSRMQILHKSLRDWLVSRERLEDADEAPMHVDVRRATLELLQAGWEEMQVEPGAAPPATLSAQDWPLAASKPPPLLRVEDACLPSRLRSDSLYSSSLLAYAVEFLPAHALSLCQPVAGARGKKKAEIPVGSHLTVLVSLLSSLQYAHMRISSEHVAAIATRESAAPLSGLNQAASALSKEYISAVAVVQRMLSQRSGNKKDAALLDSLRAALDVLLSFQRFVRSELPHFLPNTRARATQSPLAVFLNSLASIYLYAASYPDSHPVAQQAAQLENWLQQWRRCASDQFPSAVSTAAASTPLLPSGWLRWVDKPDQLSACVACIEFGSPLTSLSCAALPEEEDEDDDRAELLSLPSPPSILFAAAMRLGSYSVWDLHTLTRVWDARAGEFVCFDMRRNERATEPVSTQQAGDGRGGLRLVSGNAYRWSVLDASPSGGEELSSNINWEAARIQARNIARFHPPHRGHTPHHQVVHQPPVRHFANNHQQLQYAFAPLADRTLAIQFGSDDPVDSLLYNGSFQSIPSNLLRSRVVAAAFSHDGTLLLLSIQQSAILLAFDCSAGSRGRPPVLVQQLHSGGGDAHATCMAFTPDDDTLAAGFVSGNGGVWRRRRKIVSGGEGASAYSSEQSDWIFESMHPLPCKVHGGVSALAVSRDGGRILAGLGNNLLLVDVAQRSCVSILRGHGGMVTCAAFSDDGMYGLSGDNSVEGELRVWQLPLPDSQSQPASEESSTKLTISKRAIRMLTFSADQASIWHNGNAGLVELPLHRAGDSDRFSPPAPLGLFPSTLIRVTAVSPLDSDLVVCGEMLRALQVWSRREQRLVRELQSPLDGGQPLSQSFSANLLTSEVSSTGECSALCFSRCGRFVVGAGLYPTLPVWDVESGEIVHRVEASREGNAHTCLDLAMLHLDTSDASSSEAGVDSYLFAFCMGTRLQAFRLRVHADRSGAGAIESEQLWVTSLEEGTELRSMLLYQPLAATSTPLLFTGESRVLHIRCAMSGRLFYHFSSSSLAPSHWNNPIMRLCIVDRRGAHTSRGVTRPAGAAAVLDANQTDESVQLFSANLHGGVAVWQIQSLLQQLVKSASGSTPPLAVSSVSAPSLCALLRVNSAPLSSLLVHPLAHYVVVGSVDGALSICHWKAASEQATHVAHWRGNFDFSTAQRAELTNLIARLECEA